MAGENLNRLLFSSAKNKAIFSLTVLLLALLVLSLVLSRPNPDEGIFTTGGWLLLQGATLYSEFFSMYSPGLYFILAAVYLVFPADFVVSRLFVLAANLVTLWFFFALCRKIMDEKPALVASLFFVIWMVFTTSWNVVIEPFIVLFSVLLVYSVFSFLDSRKLKHLVLAGFLVSGLVLLKQTMVFFSTAVVLFILLRAKLNRKEFAALAVSYTLFPFLFLYYLVANNAFPEFVYQAITYNLAHSSLFAFRFHIGWMTVTPLIFLVFGIWLILMFSKRIKIETDKAVLLFIWFVLSIPTLLPVLGCCGHHSPLVPAFAIFFALAFGALFLKGGSLKFKGFETANLLKAILALVLVASIAGSGFYLSQYFFQNDFEDLFEIAEFVKENSSEEDKIHVTYWDEEIYFFSLRRPATNYLYHPFFFEDEEAAYQDEIVQSLRESRALFVVHFSRTDQPLTEDNKIYRFVLENYSVVKVVELSKSLYKTFKYGFVLRRNE